MLYDFKIIKYLNQFIQQLPLAGFDLTPNSINPFLLGFSSTSQGWDGF